MAAASTRFRIGAAMFTFALTLFLLRGPFRSDDLEEDVQEEVEAAGPDLVARDLAPYDGLGTWVDAYDYGPAYQSPGNAPAVTPADLDAMAAAGVRTIYFQANRDDERSPDGWVDEGLVAEFLTGAHEREMAVVAWYLPTFRSVRTDLGHLQDLLDYEVDGHRFDGVGVDIEFTEGVPNPAVRNQRLLRLSERLDRLAGDDPIGAIVLPPVLIEVINPDYWPGFPWAELEPLYDIWLPMSYWTFRTEESGYHDGATYNQESTVRMRDNLDNDAAIVHGIGGIGDETTGEDLVAFVDSLTATRSVGGSIYDWATLSDANRSLLARLFTDVPR
jgi:hypothetical protein